MRHTTAGGLQTRCRPNTVKMAWLEFQWDMIRRCREAGLPEPEFAAADGFVITLRRKAGEVTPRPESQPESRPESQPESLELRVLGLLAGTALSSALGQKEASGHLNQVIRVLLADQTVEFTIPDKPNSRLQQYRITERGIALLTELRKAKAP